jgi:hypothetical protein
MHLDSVATAIHYCQSVRTDWQLTFDYHEEDYPPKAVDRAMADIDKEIDASSKARASSKNAHSSAIQEWDLIVKYRADIMRLLTVNGHAPLLYTMIPIHFVLKDNDLTLLLASVGSTKVYNTLRLDARQRAAKAIQEAVLPAMKRFTVVHSTDIKNFGVLVAYGTKDFSDELSTKGELVALVAPAARCKKLADAELTEEEFVDAADVYVVDRDAIGEVRKIKVSLDDSKGK